jgi:hypothetical protein
MVHGETDWSKIHNPPTCRILKHVTDSSAVNIPTLCLASFTFVTHLRGTFVVTKTRKHFSPATDYSACVLRYLVKSEPFIR